MMSRLPWSGGQLKRGLLLVTVVSMVVLSAGCTGLLSDESADASKQTAKVPADADMLVNIDMALFTDEETQTLLEDIDEEDASNVQEMDDFYTEFKDETGLDLADLEQVTMFGMTPEDPAGEEEFAFLVDADWDTETTIDAMSDDADMELVQTEYAGEDVLWEPANPGAHDDPLYVGVHDDGQFVMGTKAAVTTSLDVSYNGADPVSGTLLDAFEGTPEGLVTFAIDATSTESQTDEFGQYGFDTLQTITGAYNTENGELSLETRLTFGDAQEATDLKGTLNFFISQSQSELDADEQQLLENVETDTEDSTLVITWGASVDTLVELANES